jgi:hypothetical protein
MTLRKNPAGFIWELQADSLRYSILIDNKKEYTDCAARLTSSVPYLGAWSHRASKLRLISPTFWRCTVEFIRFRVHILTRKTPK